MCFVFGLFMFKNNLPHTAERWYGHYLKPRALLVLTVASPPELKSKTIRYVAEVSAVIDGQKNHKVSGKILVYFSRSEMAGHYNDGDTIVVGNQLQTIPAPKNPGEFDYRRYLQRQQIFHQLFLSKSPYLVRSKKGWTFNSFINRLNNVVISCLGKHLKGAEEKGIAEALLIGYKQNLDPVLTKAYTNTGVVHIIAISGLHLGLIYMLLVWLVDLLPFLKNVNWFRTLVIITSLWIFSLMTGCSASVLRSAVMFTFIAIGKLLGRDSSMINSLVASAMILLCYDPFLLWDVGFQLSYLAIIGIATLQQPIYQIFPSLPFYVDKIWNMASITIAAQLFTFPICLYYFQQFPNYFLLSNLIAVPLSTLILFEEIFLLLVSGWDILANIAGIVVEYSIHGLNLFIQFINDLPFALTDNIPVDFWIVASLYIVLTALVYFIVYKSKARLYLCLSAILFLSISISACAIRLHNRSALIVYYIKNQFALEMVSGSNVVSYADSALLSNQFMFNKKIAPLRKGLSFPAGNFNFVENGLKMFVWNNKKILMVHGQPLLNPTADKLKIDVLLVTRLSQQNLQNILNEVVAKTIVVAAFESRKEQKKCKVYASSHNLNYFDVQENGAFYLDELDN